VGESIKGAKLGEGDPPVTFMIDQDGLEKYAQGWKKMRIQITDSTGKVHYGNRITEKPSWAEQKEDSA
jgi:hypothetical protein